MTSTPIHPDAATGALPLAELADRLAAMSRDTSLAVLDATLKCLPPQGEGFGQAWPEIRQLADHMLHATRRFAATLPAAMAEDGQSGHA